ncbi:hypothetical protein MAHJHV64_20150 [Mycobacterium avium subsp. hominissuis]|uniref:Uncharacterized protein n=1 Tax=Mycobacterium botniense TaxID=84962 RepID=A0A7I9XXA5_9MYCO|nr:hypothetical protein MBOT_17940 [Mycobacterium botniense]
MVMRCVPKPFEKHPEKHSGAQRPGRRHDVGDRGAHRERSYAVAVIGVLAADVAVMPSAPVTV